MNHQKKKSKTLRISLQTKRLVSAYFTFFYVKLNTSIYSLCNFLDRLSIKRKLLNNPNWLKGSNKVNFLTPVMGISWSCMQNFLTSWITYPYNYESSIYIPLDWHVYKQTLLVFRGICCKTNKHTQSFATLFQITMTHLLRF